jgi:hypothetical protein
MAQPFDCFTEKIASVFKRNEFVSMAGEAPLTFTALSIVDLLAKPAEVILNTNILAARLEFEDSEGFHNLAADTGFLSQFTDGSVLTRFSRFDVTLWEDPMLRVFFRSNQQKLGRAGVQSEGYGTGLIDRFGHARKYIGFVLWAEITANGHARVVC